MDWADCGDANPVILVSRHVHQQHGMFAHVLDDSREASIVSFIEWVGLATVVQRLLALASLSTKERNTQVYLFIRWKKPVIRGVAIELPHPDFVRSLLIFLYCACPFSPCKHHAAIAVVSAAQRPLATSDGHRMASYCAVS